MALMQENMAQKNDAARSTLQGNLPLRSPLEGTHLAYPAPYRINVTWPEDLFIVLLTRAAGSENSLLIQAS